MMSIDRLEERLAGLLDELAAPQTPDYFDDLLLQTANTSQRSAWSVRERWLPMLDVARRPIVAPTPLRPILVLLAMIAFLAAGLLFAGSRTPLPPVFGPATNGLIVSSLDGDIYTYDPATGVSRAIVSGSDLDSEPFWSQDGTHILFRRQASTDGAEFLYIARSDGGGLRRLSPEPLQDLGTYELSPDGRHVALISTINGFPSLSIANSDGSGISQIVTGMSMWGATFRPTGSDILFVGASGVDGSYGGLYLVDLDGTNLRSLTEPNYDQNLSVDPRWSPDGTQIAYGRWLQNWRQHRVNVMSADGTGDRVVGHAESAWVEERPVWSPDGTKLLIERAYGGRGDWSRVFPVVVSVDGNTEETHIRHDGGGVDAAWSPDGTTILARSTAATDLQQMLWDPMTGESKSAPWNATSYPSWQRIAPSPPERDPAPRFSGAAFGSALGFRPVQSSAGRHTGSGRRIPPGF